MEIPASRIKALAAALAIVATQLPVAASVAVAVESPLTISADRAASTPAGHKWAFNDYFPRTATIATGTTIVLDNGGGFHTTTLLPASISVAQDLAANAVMSVDLDDLAYNPNGTLKSLENIPPLLNSPAQGCGTSDTPCTFDGSSIVSMGAPVFGPPAPFYVKVTAQPGAYAFHCRVHPGMKGTLTVVAAGDQSAQTATQASAAAAAQASDDVTAGLLAEAAASKAAVKTNKNGTHTWTLHVGTSDADGRVAILDMLPRKVTIKPGDTVVWRPLDRNEIHTVTFPTDLNTDAIPLCEGSPGGGPDTPAVPTVNPPTSPLDFGCPGRPADEFEFDGGNGVRAVTSPKTVSDSGIVAYWTAAAGFGLPAPVALPSWSVSFAHAKKGTYTYVCQIHDGMTGTIVVH